MNARSSNFAEHRSLDQLTPREEEILAHLIQHKTSKQIGLDLEIHENTVNKAIASARAKWQTRDRYETAQVFERLNGGVENHPPQILPGDEDDHEAASAFADLPRSAHARFSDILPMEYFDSPHVPAPRGLEVLDERFGKAWRIAAIPVVALLIAMLLICVMAIAWMSSQVL